MESIVAMTPSPAATTTAAKLSEMTGRQTVPVHNLSRSVRGGTASGGGRSESVREVVRPILTKGEIMQLPKTINATDARGNAVTRKDGSVVLEQAGHQLLFRKNAPVATLVQAPHYADAVYLSRTQIPPPAHPHPEVATDYEDFTAPLSDERAGAGVRPGAAKSAVEPGGHEASAENSSAGVVGDDLDEQEWDEVADFEDAGEFDDDSDGDD